MLAAGYKDRSQKRRGTACEDACEGEHRANSKIDSIGLRY